MSAIDLLPCHACGGRASTGYEHAGGGGLVGLSGWVTDCEQCNDGPRVTRHNKDRSQEAWNQLVTDRTTHPASSTAAKGES